MEIDLLTDESLPTRGSIRNRNGTFVEIDHSGALNTYPSAINNSGEVVGRISLPAGIRGLAGHRLW